MSRISIKIAVHFVLLSTFPTLGLHEPICRYDDDTKARPADLSADKVGIGILCFNGVFPATAHCMNDDMPLAIGQLRRIILHQLSPMRGEGFRIEKPDNG